MFVPSECYPDIIACPEKSLVLAPVRVTSPSSASNLQVGILLVGERHVGSSLHLLLVLLQNGLVDLDLRRSEGGGSNEFLWRFSQRLCVIWGLSKGHTRVWLPTSFLASQRKGFSKL